MLTYYEIKKRMDDYAYYINKPFPWDEWTVLGFYAFLAENGEDLAKGIDKSASHIIKNKGEYHAINQKNA